MYITITMKMGNELFDIKVDNQQIISEAEEILYNSGKYLGKRADYYRSLLGSKVVSAYLSFAEAGIVSGDVLTRI